VSSTDTNALVEQFLDRYSNATAAVLRAYLPVREPRKHLYDLVDDYPRRAGKGLRPALCLATCRAFGGDAARVLRVAVTLELYHNAFLIHDDIEDGSEHRRGRPTLHELHGVPLALNAGDALNVLSLRPLLDTLPLLGPDLTWVVFGEIEHMVRESVEGQAIELGWVRDNTRDLTEDDYLRMTLKKTCWYTCIHPCRIGALVATGGDVDPDRFNRFGYYLGAAFQIQDDLLNLVGSVDRYGKEILGDIWEGKRTMMLIHLLHAARREHGEWLERFLATPRRDRRGNDVERVRVLMDRYGSISFGVESARQLAEAALDEFGVAYADAPPGPDHQFLEHLTTYMIERDL
jgi:geranylgeranyl diphosphate synthase type II